MFNSHLSCHAHAEPLPRSDHAVLKATSQGHSTARHGIFVLTSAVERQPVGDLPAFGFVRLPGGVPRRLLAEAYQSQMQAASVKPTFVMDEGQGNCRGTAWAQHAIDFNGPKMHCCQHWGITIFENNTQHTYTLSQSGLT
jgi:hypothetical protein